MGRQIRLFGWRLYRRLCAYVLRLDSCCTWCGAVLAWISGFGHSYRADRSSSNLRWRYCSGDQECSLAYAEGLRESRLLGSLKGRFFIVEPLKNLLGNFFAT